MLTIGYCIKLLKQRHFLLFSLKLEFIRITYPKRVCPIPVASGLNRRVEV